MLTHSRMITFYAFAALRMTNFVVPACFVSSFSPCVTSASSATASSRVESALFYLGGTQRSLERSYLCSLLYQTNEEPTKKTKSPSLTPIQTNKRRTQRLARVQRNNLKQLQTWLVEVVVTMMILMDQVQSNQHVSCAY